MFPFRSDTAAVNENTEKNIKIIEITTPEECATACYLIKSHCKDLNALGFDCEWVFWKGAPVALLQVATVHGLCYLFRLNVLTRIPSELQKILNNCDILKLGICPAADARYIERDYKVQVRSTLDLRHLYKTTSGLAKLSESELGIHLNKGTEAFSDWESPYLTYEQQHYAAMDAFVGIELFKRWLLDNSKPKCYGFSVPYQEILKMKLNEISPYLGIKYDQRLKKQKEITKIPKAEILKKFSHITRKTPLYHNCYMHAPDGELLCSCDKRKAWWYLERGLAEIIPGEPFSIKLKFEPQQRANEGNGGRYYQQLKQNCCVVCGSQESYLKHNIVPREYRKHFPTHVKDHQSHDVVLMCLQCHLKATQHAKELKQKLAQQCDAPLSTSKYKHSKERKKIKNYANALLTLGNQIPLDRRIFLETEIKKFFNAKCITTLLLEKASKLTTEIADLNYKSHGAQVVKFYTNKLGLRNLEVLWRSWFIDKMKPQFLPALWSITHNHTMLCYP
ncbi:hypothetical protein RUM44_008153 [Polyplax serrata]|uniref:3'-5' exonuclease domain-containing protein n=1 Tax=Polyplax serrata TaxID=468196 RepID=A0ABR1B7R7_POLSC